MISENDYIKDVSDTSHQSESYEISKVVTENAQLRDLNLQLKTNLKNLQTQFDEAVGVFPKMDAVNKENIKLKQQLLKSKENIDDLNQRLNILMQNSNELSTNVQSNRAVTDREHQDEISELQATIYDLQNKLKLEGDRFRSKLRNSEEIGMKAQTENSVIRNQLSKVLSLSANYFHQKFSEVSELIEFLMHPSNPENNNNGSIMNPTLPTISSLSRTEDNLEYKKKLKILKEKLEVERSQRKQLELEVLQVRKQAEVDMSKQESQFNDAEDLKRKYENEIRKVRADYQRELLQVKQQLKSAKKVHSVGMQTSPAMTDETIPIIEEATKETEILKSQLREAQNSLSQLRSQTNAFQSQINDDDKMKDKMTRKLQSARNRSDQLQKDLKDAQRQIVGLSAQLDQTNDDKANLEDQLKMFQMTADESQVKYVSTKNESRNLKKSLEYMEILTGNQGKEISELTHDRDHLLSLVHTQNQCLQDVEQIIEKLQNAAKENEAVSRNASFFAQGAPQESPQGPVEWDFGTLPDDLKLILKDLANNEGMEVDQRIKHIFGVVSKWFDNRSSENDVIFRELNAKVTNAHKTIANFATSLLHAIEQDSLDLNEIVDAVSNMYKEKLSLEQKLNSVGKTPAYCDQATYNKMNETIQNLQQVTKDLRTKEKQKKTELRDSKATFIECQKKNQEQIETLQNDNRKAQQTIYELQNQLNELHSHHKSLLDELSHTKDANTAEYNQSQFEIENARMEQASQIEEIKIECSKQVRDRDEQLFIYQNQINELESSLKQWEEISRKSTDETRKLKMQLTQLQITKDDEISQIAHQKDREIQQIEDHYQSMIEELRVKSTETEIIVASMQKGFEENEKKTRDLKDQVTKLTFQLQKSDLKAQSQLECAERSKKLIVAQLKAQLVAVETNYSVIAEEQKHGWEQEKRTLFGYLASQFGSFFDAKQALNEDAFKQVVAKIKSEIERHKKQELTIRRLLKAKENQTTEDALADLVFSIHPQLQKRTGRF